MAGGEVTAASPSHTPAGLEGMVWIPPGTFLMGSKLPDYPEEHPQHEVTLDGFWIDRYTVTVREFARFVEATDYVTVAERSLDPAEYPDLDPAQLVPGSMVFHQTRGPVDLSDIWKWWSYVPGASWQRPEGRGSRTRGRERHPVVHVAWEDTNAYAAWLGKEIPSEGEWEYAARGGLRDAIYPWGDEFTVDGRYMANTWQGTFPYQNASADGYSGTAPVGSFPPNAFGLFDMAGNVWEWTCDYYAPSHPDQDPISCCVPVNPRTLSPDRSYDPTDPNSTGIPRRVIKGGSHLCSPNYCWRYRPAARQGQMVDTGMSHLGFRCIVRGRAPAA